MKLWIIAATLSLVIPGPAPARTPEPAGPPSLESVLDRMKAYNERQTKDLKEYEVTRTFHADNKRYKMEATMEVKTTFRAPNTFDNKVVRSEGSKTIRDKVFNPILDAEKEARQKESKQAAMTPDNYKFEFVASEDCTGRTCYKLKIVPKKKDKFSVEGEIWVDAEDGAIVRVHGQPAKRPSFWTRKVEIDRVYKRMPGDFWLCDKMDTVSEIFLGGRSTLNIEHNYGAVVSRKNGN